MSSYKLSKVQKLKLAYDKENHLVYENNIILHDNAMTLKMTMAIVVVVVMMKRITWLVRTPSSLISHFCPASPFSVPRLSCVTELSYLLSIMFIIIILQPCWIREKGNEAAEGNWCDRSKTTNGVK